MKQDVLETLEFDKIREKLAELAPSQLSKAMARTLMPSVEPEIIEKKAHGNRRSIDSSGARDHDPFGGDA